ncbi:DUF4097 family beta strand repeat-containing protein [Cohnella zeiphila]|uniref:DUF4097 family beta strand repeat protein n=1 Tax=Cohnella zeiphila TaxID=2761120 RepID=A0A7X0SNH1_9BACL|nr:DUF4097 family beta strand repeat-containing protein [Cohnella zeiphila]MBB6733076.1 DUF4097 family beta strand repeat protein [Cohnella zeiphila]
MAKRLASIGIGLILVGIGGAALYGFNFGKDLPTYSQQWTFNANELHRLNVVGDQGSMEVRFQPSANGVNSVKIEGRADEDVVRSMKEARLQNGSLDVRLKPAKQRIFNLDFKSFRTRQIVTVSLTPEAENALETLNLSNDSGSMHVSGAKARTAEISTDSGSIDISGYEGKQLSLANDSGKIHAANIHADLKVKNDSGGFSGEQLVGALTVTVDSGSIHVEHLTGAAQLSVESGSVGLLKDDTSSADIKTDSGSVSVQLPSSFAGFYDLKTDSGSVHAPEAKGTSGEKIKVRTDSGSIRVSTTDE